MTKKLLYLAIAALFLTININAKAQDERLDSISFESEPLREETNPYFGVGGGYVGGFQFVNMDEINKAFNQQLKVDDFSGPMYLQGVEGFTGIIVVQNLRVGFMGVSGSKLMEKQDTVKRSIELSASMMGFTVNYGIVAVKSLAILPGMNLGWGTYGIEHYQTSGPKDWKDVNNPDFKNNYYEKFERSFMFAQPNLTIEYALTNFLVFRVSASYNLTFKNFLKDKEFTYNKTAELTNAPSGVKADGLAVQIGLFGGLFNY